MTLTARVFMLNENAEAGFPQLDGIHPKVNARFVNGALIGIVLRTIATNGKLKGKPPCQSLVGYFGFSSLS
jgi:hypothetical protein